MHPTQLSQAQHRLWLLDQLHPDKALVNLPLALRLRGQLDVEALADAVTELGRRHDALRSEILVCNDEPYQLVKSFELKLVTEDYSKLPASERQHSIARRLADEKAHAFDHSRAPLIRFFLLREATDQHVLLIVASHVLFDLWSFDVLRKQLADLYESRVRDRALPSGPRTSFVEFVARHPSSLERPEHSANLEYWKGRLAGLPASLDLPTDRGRPRDPTHEAARSTVLLPAAQCRRLRELCSALGLELAHVSLAALELVLWRYSGQSDFGVTLFNDARSETDHARLIGMFTSLLTLRSEVPAGGTFAELAGRVRASYEQALLHREVQAHKLAQVLGTGRDVFRSVPQIAFSSQRVRGEELSIEGLEIETLTSVAPAALSDLGFHVRDEGTGIVLSVDATCDLFETETGARLCRSWQRALEAVADSPSLALDDVPVMAAEDERRVLDVLNDTRQPWDETALVHRLFERQVDEHPDAVALIFEDHETSFAELDRRANRLAHLLVERGVTADSLVGLSLRRSPELVVAMLAILKAGGAYVPLDPDYPPERIEYVLADSGAKVLLTSVEVADRLKSKPECIAIDRDRAPIAAQPDTRLDREESPSQLAYVIYTSGSTGKPKGVMVEHRNATSFFVGMQHAIGLDSEGVWLAGTSISFDISVLEILGCLSHGRRLVLLGEAVLGQVEDPRFAIPALTQRHGVTHFQCTPSQVRILLLDDAGRSALASLRQLLLGGEALPQELADELTELVGGDVINLYGPTETTVWSTTSLVKRGQRVSIGRPIANTCLFVLDAQGRPVPMGAVGELYIGGPGVTRGYHQRPELTQERFVENKLRPELGARLYRTGDLVRYAPDGSITYLGRNDHQVKIRGHRIELGEIESAIRKAAGVKDVVVVARSDASDKRLVAYLVTDPDFAGVDGLRTLLRSELPDFMLPAAIVQLDALPLTPNGKVDRNALPEPEAASVIASEYVAPRTPDECKLSEIWQRALGVPRVGATDNFFDLGGHSLLAVKISNEVERAFGVRLPLATLFECPTLEALAQRLGELSAHETNGTGPDWTTIVPIQPQGSLPAFYCVAGVGGNPMNLRHLASALGTDQPFYGFQMRGVDGQQQPHRRVRPMAEECLADLKARQPNGPYYLGGYSFGGLVALEMAHMLREAGEQVPLLVLFDTMNPRLPGWKFKERVDAHLSNLRERGAAYFANRIFARLRAEVERRRRKLRARLARLNHFQYRNDAVWEASEEAMHHYQPRAYDGQVLLLQADWRLTAGDGIGLRPHESNGWRDLVAQLEIVEIPSSHVDVVSEQASPMAATALRSSLARAREQSRAAAPTSSPASSREHKSSPALARLEKVA